MPVVTIDNRPVHVTEEGFLSRPEEWDEGLAQTLARNLGITLTEEHWKAIRFLRRDYADRHETPTLRRISTAGGVSIKQLFELFPQKPAKQMAYIAGLPKPQGCV